MDGLLVDVSRLESDAGDWAELVRGVRREMAELRSEVASLRRENLAWVFHGEDTVVYVLDPYRSRDVLEGHFTAGIRVVLMMDRRSSYKAMAPVKAGLIVLAFCGAHVRRDFISAAKSFPSCSRGHWPG